MSELLAQLLVAADADRFHGRCRDACHLVRAFHRLGGSRCVSARHDVANLGRIRPRSHHRTDRVLPFSVLLCFRSIATSRSSDRLEAASAYEVRRMRGVRLSRAVRLRAVPELPHAAPRTCAATARTLRADVDGVPVLRDPRRVHGAEARSEASASPRATRPRSAVRRMPEPRA